VTREEEETLCCQEATVVLSSCSPLSDCGGMISCAAPDMFPNFKVATRFKRLR
jgi:hypothetical protein